MIDGLAVLRMTIAQFAVLVPAVAIAAGALGNEVDIIAGKMVAEKKVRIDRAEEFLKEVRK